MNSLYIIMIKKKIDQLQMKNDDVESTIESIQSQSRVSGIYPNFYVCAPSPGARRLDLQQI